MSLEMRQRVVRHGMFWAAMTAFFVLIQLPDHFVMGTPIYWKQVVFNQLPACLITIYPLLYWLLPRLLQRRQLPLFLALLVGWVLACVYFTGLMRMGFIYVVDPVLFGVLPKQPLKYSEYLGHLNFGFFALMVVAGGAVAIKVAQGWHQQWQLSQQLQQRRLQAELQLLKAQLQPTFLFNTLQTLHGLTQQHSPDSPAAVLHLSALLRYLLYASPQDAVPLADEVAMIQHYVALEKLRLGSSVEVSLSCSGRFDAHHIAPMLLLPLVENAFRHGSSKEPECSWLSIDLVAKKNSLAFKVINSQAGGGPAWREGAGLRRLRQRLTHLYPGQHELKVVTEPDTFLIALHLRLAAAPPALAALPPLAPLPTRQPPEPSSRQRVPSP